MLTFSLVPLSLLLVLFDTLTHALRLPLQARSPAPTLSHTHTLSRRAAAANSSVPLVNFENLEYIVNITLGGVPFAVSIDTGR